MSKWKYSVEQVANLKDLSHTEAKETHDSQQANVNPGTSYHVQGDHRNTGNQTFSESQVTKAKKDDQRPIANAADPVQNEKMLELLPWKEAGSYAALLEYFDGKEKKVG